MSDANPPAARSHRSPGWLVVVGILGMAIGFGAAIPIYSHRERQALSTRELATALGMHHWEYTIPDNNGTQILTFEIRDGDSVRTSGGQSGWKPGETVKVTVRTLMDSKQLEAAIIGSTAHGRFLLPNPFAGLNSLHYTPDGFSVNNQPLIRGNPSGSIKIGPGNVTQPGDVALSLVMK